MKQKFSNTHQISTLLANALKYHHNRDYDDAISTYRAVLDIDNNNFDALNLYGSLMLQRQDYSAALDLLSKAVKINSKNAISFNNLGISFKNLKRYDEALESYNRAIAINPLYAEAFFNRSNLYSQAKKFEEALPGYDKAIKLQPNYIEAILNKANTLAELQRYEDAIEGYEIVLKKFPENEGARVGLAQSLRLMKNFQKCFECLHAVISQKSSAVMLAALGDLYRDTERLDLSMATYEAAISIDPKNAGAWFGKAVVLSKLKRFKEAISCYLSCKEFDKVGQYKLVDHLIIHEQMLIAEWSDYDFYKSKINDLVLSGANTVPFVFLSLFDDPLLHLAVAKSHVKNARIEGENKITARNLHHKIRIGYFSADFSTHPVSLLLMEVFQIQNRELFEIVAFCIKKPRSSDEIYEKLVGIFDYFIDVEEKSDREVSEISREMEIDIAVDLGGYTDGARSGIFAFRAAPIQINFFGYPSTTGANYMDYMIADHVVIPAESKNFFVEKIAYMPNSYLVDDSNRRASDTIFTKTDLGLPEDKFIYCCFNNAYKFNYEVLGAWAKIMKTCSNSVIWLTENNLDFKKNILKEFLALGISEDRVIFAKKLESMSDHLARYQFADLFLDTHPYNAHTTALDSLKMGVPVLTYCGKAFAGRVASSLLTCLDLKELITDSLEQYISIAIQLYSSPHMLVDIKNKLKAAIKDKPLFDTKTYVNNLEVLYLEMYRRHLSGLPPETFSFEDVKLG